MGVAPYRSGHGILRTTAALDQTATRVRSVGFTIAVLFGSLFTVQASLVVLSPILPRVASELQVTVSAVGQLRTISGVVAAAVAVVMVVAKRRHGLREILAAGLGLLVVGALASALAPTFGVLALAQIILGVGVALTLTGGLAATRRWIPAGQRGRALSWTLIGQPAAWIVGLPVVGMLGDRNWRLAWLVPLLAGMATLLALLWRGHDSSEPSGPSSSPARRTSVLTWAASELLAYAGWTAVLIYVGALFAEAYATSAGTTGVLLGLGAVAYLPGNFLVRRWAESMARPLSIGVASAMALTGLVLCTVRVAIGFSFAMFALFAFFGGARTTTGSALGLGLGGADPFHAMSLRTASVQFGYMAGGGLGGISLAIAGWNGLGAMLTVFLALSSALLVVYKEPGPPGHSRSHRTGDTEHEDACTLRIP